MAGFPIPPPKFRATTSAGAPLTGGKVYVFSDAGGTSPQTTYSDSSLSVANAHPVVLNARGEADIFVSAGVDYWVRLTDASGTEIWALTPVSVPSTAAAPAAASPVPTGSVLPFAGATVPSGFLECNGAAVSRTTYADLFTAIGTTFGTGDGTTTFNVPDMRQRFPLGKAAAGTGSTLGATGGTIDHTHSIATHTHTLSTDGAHTHTVSRHGWGSGSGTPDATGTLFARASGGATALAANNQTTSSNGSHTHTVDAGGTTATDATNPAYATVLYIIKI